MKKAVNFILPTIASFHIHENRATKTSTKLFSKIYIKQLVLTVDHFPSFFRSLVNFKGAWCNNEALESLHIIIYHIFDNENKVYVQR